VSVWRAGTTRGGREDSSGWRMIFVHLVVRKRVHYCLKDVTGNRVTAILPFPSTDPSTRDRPWLIAPRAGGGRSRLRVRPPLVPRRWKHAKPGRARRQVGSNRRPASRCPPEQAPIRTPQPPGL
jgi:hypothetical protein